MTQHDSPQKNWEPCTYGVIHETAGQRIVSRSRKVRLFWSGAALVLVGSMLSMAMSSQDTRNGIPAKIDCLQVNENLVSYTTAEILDKSMNRRITFHLMKCKHCRLKYSTLLCELDPARCKPGEKRTLKPCVEHQAP